MTLDDITPLILTYNEEANIERTLAGLTWARQILVVDSGSDDSTLNTLASHPSVQVVHRRFDDFASQCNFGLTLIRTSWVLSIDADYVCLPDFENELRALIDEFDGAEASFVYCIMSHPLRACLYPPRIVLFRPNEGRYVADGHAHRLKLSGKIVRMNVPILHDDLKPLSRWLAWQAKYADLEVAKLLSEPPSRLGWKDRLRKRVVFAPLLTLIYCLFVKRLVMDGWPGVYYSLQRTYAELLLSLKLVHARLAPRAGAPKTETTALAGDITLGGIETGGSIRNIENCVSEGPRGQ